MRSCLGAYVGALGPLLRPMLAVLGLMLAVLGRLKARSGPNPSGKAIWQGDQGGIVAQTRARRPFRRGDLNCIYSGPGPPMLFSLFLSDSLSLYIYIHILYIYIYTVLTAYQDENQDDQDENLRTTRG